MRENVLKSGIGEKSLKQLLKKFQAESYRIMQNAAEASVVEASVMGEGLARGSVNDYPKKSDLTGDLPTVTRTDPTLVHGNYESEIVLHGKNAVFFEFGAGQFYNAPVGSSRHPNPGKYTIGSYPNQKHAGQDYWYLPDGVETQGGKKTTHGILAIMPLHNTKISIMNYAKNRAKRGAK